MADAENDDKHNANVAVIAAAYLGNPSNPVERSQISEVIREIYLSLKTPLLQTPPAEPELEKPSPAAIRKSVTHEHLISFIDGKPYKSLKRHLASNGFTPHSYRERFGLRPDYPMTAPSYSEQRSALAKTRGFGQRPLAGKTVAGAPVEARPDASTPAKLPRASKAKAAPAVNVAPAVAKPAVTLPAKPARASKAKAAAATAPEVATAPLEAKPAVTPAAKPARTSKAKAAAPVAARAKTPTIRAAKASVSAKTPMKAKSTQR